MKLLVLAQTPPPVHGQSVMVQILVEGLPRHGVQVRHIPLGVSREAAEIGRVTARKLFVALQIARRAANALREEQPDAIYYVPAPGKRAAVWRDILVLGRLRRRCPSLVLHFHAAGIADWLNTAALPGERGWARRALGQPDLAIVLAHALARDATELGARRVAVVPNGIPDPAAAVAQRPARAAGAAPRIVFLGALTREKGVDDLIAAAARLYIAGDRIDLVLAGGHDNSRDRARIERAAAACPAKVSFAGFVTGEAKAVLLRSADALCLPTYYPYEAQPIVLLEGLAHDLPIVATRWRGIPETLPPGNPLAEPRDPVSLAAALRDVLRNPPRPGANRAYFLERYTTTHHLGAMSRALHALSRPDSVSATATTAGTG